MYVIVSFSQEKLACQHFHGVKLLRLAVTILPAVLKTRSDATLVSVRLVKVVVDGKFIFSTVKSTAVFMVPRYQKVPRPSRYQYRENLVPRYTVVP